MDINKCISDNMGLVYKQLHRFNRAYDDDAFSHALEALSNAARTYDESKSVAFSTYASVCIYNKIAWYLREEARVKLQVISYEEPAIDGTDVRLVDTLADPEATEDNILKNELYDNLWRAFDIVYNSLPNDVSKQIIALWRESEFTASQTVLAQNTGVSQAHVSRTLSAFKHKLKKEMEEYLC